MYRIVGIDRETGRQTYTGQIERDREYSRLILAARSLNEVSVFNHYQVERVGVI